MKFRGLVQAGLVSALVVAAAQANAATNSVANGDFSTGLADWTSTVPVNLGANPLTNGAISVGTDAPSGFSHDVAFTATPGFFSLGISQTIAAPIGVYTLSFYLKETTNSGFSVLFDGSNPGTTSSAFNTDGQWHEYTFTVSSSSLFGTPTLSFSAIPSLGAPVEIAGISVLPTNSTPTGSVPEPESMVLWLSGAMALVAARRGLFKKNNNVCA